MRLPPPVYVVAAAVLQRRLAPQRTAGAPRKAAAATVAAAALALDATATMQFRRRRTTVDPLRPARASSLVGEGPFRFTRNPMYVGMAGLLAAHALARGGWRTLLPVAAFVVVIDRTQVPAEEAALRELFGAEYDAYRARVPRWLGRVRA